MSTGKIRIILADGQPVVIEGLTSMFARHPRIAVVATTASPAEASAAMRKEAFDILLTDLHLVDRMDGLELIRDAAKNCSKSRFVVLSASEKPADIMEANQAGAHAYLLKCTPLEEIGAALETVHQGGRPPLSAELEASIWQKLKGNPGEELPCALSYREWAVLRMIVRGATNDEIAGKLNISCRMVRRANTAIYGKLGVRNRAEAVARAVQEGWFR